MCVLEVNDTEMSKMHDMKRANDMFWGGNLIMYIYV